MGGDRHRILGATLRWHYCSTAQHLMAAPHHLVRHRALFHNASNLSGWPVQTGALAFRSSPVLRLCHVLAFCRYIFIAPPLTPFLNTAFTKLDGVFPLFGTAFFALYCFYLLGAAVADVNH